jgi:cysteine-rich repeat protein
MKPARLVGVSSVLLLLLAAGCARQGSRPPEDGGVDAAIHTCGDGVVDPQEACDDGNLADGDECSPACAVEPGWTCAPGSPSGCTSLCGNGTVDAGEACDGAQLGGKTCLTVPGGFTSGTLTCSASCQLDTTGCVNPDCGNGVVDPGEACDDGNTTNTDACLSNCTAARCGDGYVWAGHEACDDGNTANTDACLSSCTAARCGDGYVWAGHEACDDGNTTPGDGCSATCTLEPAFTLHAVSNPPAGWTPTPVYTQGVLHAPGSAIRAAANNEQRGVAYVFTATTYHVLTVPGFQWVDSGDLATVFVDLPGASVDLAWGVSRPDPDGSYIGFKVGEWAYNYDIDNATGAVSPLGEPARIDWSNDPLAPALADLRLGWLDLENAHGWAVDPDAGTAGACAPSGTPIGPYLGLITTQQSVYLWDAGYCGRFLDAMPVATFPPFALGLANRPDLADAVASFYMYTNDSLYLLTVP